MSDIESCIGPQPVVFSEIVRSMLWPRTGQPTLVILVVDDADDELATVIDRGHEIPSEHFGGVWGTAQQDGRWLVGFHLTEVGGGFQRGLLTDKFDRRLLEAILDVPHLVALLPQAIAGDARTAKALAPRLGGGFALIIEVAGRSEQVAHVLSSCRAQLGEH